MIGAVTEQPFARVPHLGVAEAEAMAVRARAAFETGAWRRMAAAIRSGGGSAPARLRGRGYVFAPTVVETADNCSPLRQEEIFGPFVTIQRVRDLDDALVRANHSQFGLASYVWSDDLPSVMRARKALRAGTVWVNTPMARDLRSPFGGYKQSGIGRDGLPGSIDLFTEEKTTIIPDEPLRLPRFGAAPPGH